jgi:hypothetical protein
MKIEFKRQAVETQETVQQPVLVIDPYTILYSAEFFGALGVALLAGYKWVLEPWINKKKATLAYSREQDEAIDLQLDAIREKAGADRVLLVQSYVKATTTSGDELKAIAITHQRRAEGVPLIAEAIPTTPNDACIRSMFSSLRRQPFIKRSTQDIEADMYRIYLVATNVALVTYCFLALDDKEYGFIAIHYCKPEEDNWSSLTQDMIQSNLDKLLYHILNKKTFIQTLQQLLSSK